MYQVYRLDRLVMHLKVAAWPHQVQSTLSVIDCIDIAYRYYYILIKFLIFLFPDKTHSKCRNPWLIPAVCVSRRVMDL